MITSQLTHILDILKKWLSRLARRSASLFCAVLSFLHRFVAGYLKFGNRRLIARFPSRALPRSQADIWGEDVPICSSLLPPDPMGLEAAGEPPSPSDDPYTGTHSQHSRPLRKGTAKPPLEATPTATGYPSENELHQGSTSSVHLQMGESSVTNRTFLKDPLQESSSPGPSRFSGLHEVSRTHSRPHGYMDDAHSINTTRTPSMRHLAPDMPYSQYASGSRLSVSTGRSHTRSIAGSESRQAAYRTHKGPVNSRPGSIHSSIHHEYPNTVIPLDSSAQAVPVSDPGIDHHVHFTAPPDSDEQPGSEVVVVYDYDGPPIAPMAAAEVKRYQRGRPRVLNASKTTVPAMTIAFPAHDMDVPKGWTTLVHPEGFRYFVHKENRTFTDLDICDPVICDDIEYYMQYLFDELRRTVGLEKLDMNQVDLVLEPKVFDGDSVVCCYYFVNHRNRCLFWLDDFHAEQILSECKGIENLSHIGLAIQAQYWCVPVKVRILCPVAQDLVDEVKNTLAHAACDHLTSKQSSAAFDTVELRDYLSVVDSITVHDPADQSMRRCHAAIVIGRVMYSFSHNHFVNYHGEDCARLIFEQTVHDRKYQTSPWMAILTPLLFFYPVTQIHELHKIYVDEIVCTGRWNIFSSKFKGQLQDSNLLATVLLNANVGFLAINTVDKGGRDAIQMASYMSLVTSLGSIVLGLFFVSHGRISAQNTAEEVANFLSSLHDEKHGLEKLAVIFSLPKALLMWGMLFFFAAFSIDWWTAGDITSRTIVGTVTLVVFAMVSNSVLRTRERERYYWSLRSTLLHRGIGLTLLSRLGDVWKQIMEFTGIEKNLVGPLPEDAEVDAPGPNDRDTYPTPYTPPIRPYHPTAPADSPQQPHDVDPVLPSSDSHTNPGFLSGASSLQQIREDTPTVFQDQSTIEARCERDISASEGMIGTAVNATLHSEALPATATILSEHELQTAAVAVDTDAPILPGSFCTEEREDVKYTENVVEEPGELDHPQPSLSTTPPPRIFARSATNDYFHHAPAAPKWTLEDGHDIEECQE